MPNDQEPRKGSAALLAEKVALELTEERFATLERTVVMLAQMVSAHHRHMFGDDEFPSPPTADDIAEVTRLDDWMERVAEYLRKR